MYIAHFEMNKREPERIYFSASERAANRMEFAGGKKEPIRFVINKDKHLEIY